MNCTLSAIAFAAPLCLLAAEYDNTVTRTFPLQGSAERRLIVENINGNIRVTGDNGTSVRLVVHEHWSADTDEALRHGREDIKVEMSRTGNTVAVKLEGPWRESRHREDDRYQFRHDYEVQVPAGINLDLKTVNGRDLTVSGVQGDMRLRNVNGAISAQGAAGTVIAKTINGGVKVTFARNPAQACSFETLNGTLDVSFRPDLNADLGLQTMHGEAYTDFEIAPVAVPVTAERSEHGNRYRVDRFRTVRVGSGGIRHSFKTLNGSIKVRKG